MATRSPGSVFAAGLVLQGRYRLDEALALGGMAEVWRGHDLVLQRQVAIKLLHPHLASDPSIVERFRREAISAARLAHPHIVPTYDAGTDNEAAYIVLGLIHGPTLAEILSDGTLEVRQAVSIGRQVADALHHAHVAGLVHRDIKPSNILVVDQDHRVMVADFGIAKAVAATGEEALTLPGLIVGTPAYLAPEQAGGEEADARSDVYATGVLIHEMLCGHTATDLPTQISEAQAGASPSARCDRLPQGLREIVEKATATDPSSRYQTAQELRDVLARFEQANGHGPAKTGPSRMAIAPPRPPRARSKYDLPGDTGPHEAVPSGRPLVPEHPTEIRPMAPPASDAAPLRGRSVRNRRRNAVFAVALALIVIAIAIGRFVGSAGNDASTAPATTAPALALVAARSFDPLGDRTENQAAAANAVDGDVASAWSTETYSNRRFGNLKAGVGVIVEANAVTRLSKLEVSTASNGWAASIFVSDTPKDTLEAWGAPVDVQSGLGTAATFDLHGATGGAVLIWITDLGDANRVTLNGTRVFG